MKIRIISPAKVNLFLKVGDKRPDGYHDIVTLFERIGLCDYIDLEVTKDAGIKLSCNNPCVPQDKTNLAFKAAAALKRDFPSRGGGVRIHIDKRIPPGSGLGGGSSNAAAALLGLNRLWRLRLSIKQLTRYARDIGADTAFFLRDKPFALGRGRGDEVSVLRINRSFWHILVIPKINISTRYIYGKVKRNLSLTKGGFDAKISIYALSRGGKTRWQEAVANDLQEVALREYPRLGRIIRRLRQLGCAAVAMSGSGGAVFGLAQDRREGEEIIRRLKIGRNTEVFLVKTYRQACMRI